jgi:fructokinase
MGEVIWDIFEHDSLEHCRQLGGAALNFAAHASRLGHDTTLISAVGADSLGQEASQSIAALGLDTMFVQKTARFPTGTAHVESGPDNRTSFVIERPAAYDAIDLSCQDIQQLAQREPAWFYYGTLVASRPEGHAILCRLLDALPAATRFYDANLRLGCDSAPIVTQLLGMADIVKLNEDELRAVHEFTGLPLTVEAFCRGGCIRYGWKAVCVTLGARGCAMHARGEYVEAYGYAVEVVDTVGAGDAFAAAFLHGLDAQWPIAGVAAFANRVGALVASRRGAIPAWSIEEAAAL